MPGAGTKHVHVQLCIALHLLFDKQKFFLVLCLALGFAIQLGLVLRVNLRVLSQLLNTLVLSYCDAIHYVSRST